MKIGLRILLGYFLLMGLVAWFVLNVFAQEVKPGVRGTLEDTLIDTSQLLADLVSEDLASGRLQDSDLVTRMPQSVRRSLDASIGGIRKNSLDYRVYVTNELGIVLFDSSGRDVGKDYSRWNDVYLTLRGKYGARSTRANPYNENSTVMHVAAPIRDGERIIGVLTVAKPNATVQPFVERSEKRILLYGAVLLVASLLISLGFAWWLTQSLRKLQHYVADVEAGRKAALPELGNDEIGVLGRALEGMRHRLEGKEYVEELMHTLAHELKSPIAAIQGSAELLREDMPEDQRRHFLANILEQNSRQKELIDKLLALITVEKQQRLAAPQPVRMDDLLNHLRADYALRLAEKNILLEVQADDPLLRGDLLLLRQALGNLLDNAIDFAPAGSILHLAARRDGADAVITLCDRGAGIPAYARERVFDRFYSLPRPDGAKSTGIGLPFVREVALLHGGSIRLHDREGGGTCAELRIPLA